MPEIGECYSIARKIPRMGMVNKWAHSERFYKYINLDESFKSLPKEFILGQSFAYGKSIWFPITTPVQHGFLIVQLGMSGSFFLDDTGRDEKNDHLWLENNSQKLRYSDPRMFGKMKCFLIDLTASLADLQNSIIKSYKWGLDPHQSSLTELMNQMVRWQKSTKNIKSLMLEQNIIFGIGNYLASEILHKSKINPHTPGKNLSPKQIQSLAKATKDIVAKAIKTGGYSFAGGYFHPDGSKGQMAKYIKAYEKEGKVCPICKTGIIKKEFINSRSTYWCPVCQNNKKGKKR